VTFLLTPDTIKPNETKRNDDALGLLAAHEHGHNKRLSAALLVFLDAPLAAPRDQIVESI
jgi:hypothetical protein